MTTPSFGRATLTTLLVLALFSCRKEEQPAPTPPPVVAPQPEHLTLGNPSEATADLINPNNYLISKAQYALAYNNSRGTAAWVSWHLSTNWLGNVPRCDCFMPDTDLPTGFFQAVTWDYSGSGFDRGHLCPSSDRDASDSDNAATFLLERISK